MTKMKDKERLLKAVRGKQQITYTGSPMRLSTDSSEETLRSEESGTIHLKQWKGKNYNQAYSTQQDSCSDIMKR